MEISSIKQEEIIKDLKNFCVMSKKEENFIYYSEYKFCKEIAERVQGLLDLYIAEKELSENRYKEIVRLSNEIGCAKEEIKNLNNLLDMKKEINNDLEKRLSDLELQISEE